MVGRGSRSWHRAGQQCWAGEKKLIVFTPLFHCITNNDAEQDEHLMALTTAPICCLFSLLGKSSLSLKMGRGWSYQAYVAKSVKQGNIDAVKVQEWKSRFYRSFMGKPAFRLLGSRMG